MRRGSAFKSEARDHQGVLLRNCHVAPRRQNIVDWGHPRHAKVGRPAAPRTRPPQPAEMDFAMAFENLEALIAESSSITAPFKAILPVLPFMAGRRQA